MLAKLKVIYQVVLVRRKVSFATSSLDTLITFMKIILIV